MNLYGNDMDESTHPLESGLGWTVALEPRGARLHRPRGARGDRARAARERKLVGLVLEDRGVLRSHQKVIVTGGGRGRDHQRHLLADARALDRARARAGGHRRRGAGGMRGKLLNARVVQAAVRAPRQITASR